MKPLFVAAIALTVCSSSTWLPAQTRTFPAAALYDQSIVENLHLALDGGFIELASGELIEDDGPAAGYTYQPNVENLGGDVWAKKTLLLGHPAARRATLVIAPGGDVNVSVNGHEVRLEGPRKVGGYWQAYSFDPAVLRRGANELVFRGSGKLWIAREEDYVRGSTDRSHHPNRSAKSRDGGQTWDDANLGAGDNLDGEYYVRLFLDRHLPEGRLTTPVFDLGNLDEESVGQAVENIGPVTISLDADLPKSSRVEVCTRRGSTFAPAEATWTPWRKCELSSPTTADPNAAERGAAADELRFVLPSDASTPRRYLQLEIRFTTDDPLSSPRLKSLIIAAKPQVASDWTKRLRIAGAKNPPVVRSSIPFEYEPFDHPSLKKLREQYRLDEVVRGAATELELISHLAAWSATRWSKVGHLGEAYPPWNALEILAPHADGTPVGGFCLQYNLVFLQACESFGIPGRVVSIGAGDQLQKIRGGHEVVELWSNQFEKWIYVDGNTAWCALDEATGVPLSLLELRDRQLAAWSGEEHRPLRVVKLADTRHGWPSLDTWPPFVELRLVPRSNFLEQPFPLPLNQGMRGWFWTGHYVWSDEKQPDRPIYSHRVRKRGNWEWTLNHAHIVLEPTATPGEVRVHFDSNTPGFAVYLASIDGEPQKPFEAVFTWKVQPGKNRLAVQPRNVAGREGIETWVEVEFVE